MARQNPYQMDPFLAQGFSSLTKALIGDAETDYQVARTNRVNELLPLEKRQIEAQILGSNASADAARALQTLRNAQTLTENELRNPRVQSEIANAQATLALAAERNASASANTALADQRNQLTPSMVASENALATSRLADADAATALGKSRLADAMLTTQTTQPTVNKLNAETSAATSLASERDANAAQINALTTPKVEKTNAETSAATALANERNTSAELNTAKAESERRIVLNKGQTIVTTNAEGKRETYTAPENVSVTLEPGEEATVLMADGTEKKIIGPPISNKRTDSDAKNNNAEIDRQIGVYFNKETGAFPNVNNSVLKRIRSSLYNDDEIAGKGPDVAARVINDLLSQTFNGQTEVKISTAYNDGVGAFYIPAFVANVIAQGLSVETIVELYGLSREQAKIAQAELTAR